MQKRSFVLLLGATVMLVGAAVFALVRGDRAVSPPDRPHLAFPHLAAQLDDLAWVRLVHGSTTADLGSIAGHWAVVEKGNYPAAQSTVRRLFLGLADLALVEPKTERPELFGRLGLDDPKNGKSTLVILQDRTGATVAQLIIGKTRRDWLGGGNDGVYVRKPDENRTWLARGSFELPGNVTGWLDRRIVDIPASRIAAVTLTGPEGAALVLQRSAPGAGFAVADAPAASKLKDAAALAGPAGALTGLDLDDVKPEADLPVPTSGVATAVFATFNGLTVKLRLFAHDNVDWVALKAAGGGKAEAEAAAINDRVARWTYAIPAARAKLLRTKLADLVASPKGS